jgi:hypothetical protein
MFLEGLAFPVSVWRRIGLAWLGAPWRYLATVYRCAVLGRGLPALLLGSPLHHVDALIGGAVEWRFYGLDGEALT